MAQGRSEPGSVAAWSPAVTGNLIALFSTVLWSSAFPATEYLLRGWDPLVLCVARLSGAALSILLLTLVWARSASWPGHRGAMSGSSEPSASRHRSSC